MSDKVLYITFFLTAFLASYIIFLLATSINEADLSMDKWKNNRVSIFNQMAGTDLTYQDFRTLSNEEKAALILRNK